MILLTNGDQYHELAGPVDERRGPRASEVTA